MHAAVVATPNVRRRELRDWSFRTEGVRVREGAVELETCEDPVPRHALLEGVRCVRARHRADAADRAALSRSADNATRKQLRGDVTHMRAQVRYVMYDAFECKL